jgi:hypothetical protein
VRYIHLNLLRAGWVKDMAELSRNPWSGHSALMGKIKREWQDTDCVLSLFGQDRYRRRDYEKYVQKGAASGRRPFIGDVPRIYGIQIPRYLIPE